MAKVHGYPTHADKGMAAGAVVFPMENRRLAAAKYCPRMDSGASFEIKLSCNPTTRISAMVKIKMVIILKHFRRL